MEKHIVALEAINAASGLDYDGIEDTALEMAIEEVYEANGKKWKPWAKNAKSMRMGDIILIVDSDTIVPEVSFLLGYRTATLAVECFQLNLFIFSLAFVIGLF